MTIYDLHCKKCDIYFEVDAPMSDPPKWRRCSVCGGRANRVYYAPPVHFKGIGWPGQALKNKKRFDMGMDKQEAHQFYNSSMKASEEAMKRGGEVYKSMVPNMEKLIASGQVKKVDSKKAVKKKELHKRLTKEALDTQKRINGDNPIHPQTI